MITLDGILTHENHLVAKTRVTKGQSLTVLNLRHSKLVRPTFLGLIAALSLTACGSNPASISATPGTPPATEVAALNTAKYQTMSWDTFNEAWRDDASAGKLDGKMLQLTCQVVFRPRPAEYASWTAYIRNPASSGEGSLSLEHSVFKFMPLFASREAKEVWCANHGMVAQEYSGTYPQPPVQAFGRYRALRPVRFSHEFHLDAIRLASGKMIRF